MGRHEGHGRHVADGKRVTVDGVKAHGGKMTVSPEGERVVLSEGQGPLGTWELFDKIIQPDQSRVETTKKYTHNK